jgi:DNA repair protein RadC
MSREEKKKTAKTIYHSRIKEWPQNERPREKLLAYGASSLSEAELLAILIRTGTREGTAVDVARALLQTHNNSLSSLASRSAQEIMKEKGLKHAKAIALVAAFELGRRAASNYQQDRLQVRSPLDVVNRYQPLMRDLKTEIFKVILLDSANHIIHDAEVSRGTLNSSLAHSREIFRSAISAPAASIILLHNHPSGNPEPSPEDIQITRQIVQAGKIIEIPIHDHIIIAGASYTSFAEKGLL